MNACIFYRKILVFLVLIELFFTIKAQHFYFGDLHVHSNFSDGRGTPQQVYNYAKDITKLDFICITDHDVYPTDLTPRWQKTIQIANENNIEDKFITFIGYEFTRYNLEGHRTIIYPGDTGQLFTASEYDVNKLMELVHENGGIVNIAHPNSLPFASKITTLKGFQENNIEIFSIYRYEYYNNPQAPSEQLKGSSVQDWLARGKVLGFLGVTDTHYTQPGSIGLTGVYTNELKRGSIFNALKQRHTFATNGYKVKALLSFKENIMGDIIVSDEIKRTLEYDITGTDTLVKIDLVRNNMVLDSIFPYELASKGRFSIDDSSNFSYYYIRVLQKDGGIAITSPLYFYTDKYFHLIKNGDIINLFIYPNPTSGNLQLLFNQTIDGEMIFSLFNQYGTLLKKVNTGFQFVGNYNYDFDFSEYDNGIYFLVLQIGNHKMNSKVVLIK